jgi:hypothetical protein
MLPPVVPFFLPAFLPFLYKCYFGNIVRRVIDWDAKTIEITRIPLFRTPITKNYKSWDIEEISINTYDDSISIKLNGFTAFALSLSAENTSSFLHEIHSTFGYRKPVVRYFSDGGGGGG